MYPGNRAHPAALILLLFTFAHLGSPPRVAAQKERSTLISEFLADNEEGLLDSRGERPDWIELHNSGTAPVAGAAGRSADVAPAAANTGGAAIACAGSCAGTSIQLQFRRRRKLHENLAAESSCDGGRGGSRRTGTHLPAS